MSQSALPQILARIAPTRRITPEDALDIRRALFGDMAVSPLEAETLIALDEAAVERCPEWTMLFTEAVTDFIVRQQHPPGYVDDAGADWLISLVGRDGRIRTDTELDLLIHILETADAVPQKLSDFALDQVKDAVLTGEGPLARAGRVEAGRITPAEVELLRRIIFAAGGSGDIAVTRHEAETLFEINDAVKGQDNDPAWADFFARAVGASVMTVSTYDGQSREDAARRAAWLEEPPEGLLGFAGRMRPDRLDQGFLETMSDAFREPSHERDWAAQNAEDDADLAAAERVTADEANWVLARIGADGSFDPAEKALIAFLKQESPQLDEAIDPLVDEAEFNDTEVTPAIFGRRRAL
jgi:hypothetical protein